MSKSDKTYEEIVLELSRKDSRLPEDAFGQEPYDMYCVPIEVYEKYKDDVRWLGLSYQRWVAPEDGSVLFERVNQLSDQEMAEKLGLEEETVRRIRCMADFDFNPEMWRNAAAFKRNHRLENPLGGTDRPVKGEPF